jgi:hypothetical protein
MAVRDAKMLSTDKSAWKCLTMPIGTSAISQTDLEVDEITPGFNFEIVKVEVYATSVTATASVNVLIGSTTALASVITPTTANVVAGTLATSKAARRGSSTESIIVQYTTNGSGVIVNGKARVWIRPFPMSGEALPTAGL